MDRKRAVILEQDRDKRLHLAAALKGPDLALRMSDSEADLFSALDTQSADVVVLRAEMEKASGYSVCNRLRSSDKTSKTKIVLVVTNPNDPRFAAHKASPQAADAYIAPPLGLRDLRLQAYSLLDLDGGTLSDEDIQQVEEDPLSMLDEALAGATVSDSTVDRDAGRQKADFTDDDIAGAFGALDGSPAPAPAEVEEADTIDDNEIIEAEDVVEVPKVAAKPSPLAQLSEEDLSFVASAFQRGPQKAAPPLPPPSPKANKELRGPEAKIAMLRDSLREREQELSKLQEIWQAQERAYKESAQRVSDMEVEVRAAQIDVRDLQHKIKEKEDEIKRLKREASASSDRMLEEKVMLEKDLIEVVASKEKNVAELRRILSSREREIERLNAELQQKTTEHESFKQLSALAMSDLRSQTDTAMQLQNEKHAGEKQALEEAARQREAALSEKMAASETSWFERYTATDTARGNFERELADTKLTLESTEAERARTQAELEKKELTLNEAYQQIANEVERLRAITGERDGLIELRDKLTADVETRDARIKTQDEELALARTDKDGLAQRLGERLTQKDSVVEQLTKEVQVMREDKEALQARLSERLREREATVAEQKQQLEQQQIEKLQREKASEVDKTQLETRLAELQRRYDQLAVERDKERQRLQNESELMSLKLVELQQQASEKLSAQLLEMEQLKQLLRTNGPPAAKAAEGDVLQDVEKKLGGLSGS